MKTSLWLSLDKEGENDLSVGGYAYSFNNPINFTDPDGNWPDLPSWKQIQKSYNNAKNSVVKTYNESKASASLSYNETKANVSRNYDQAKNYAKQKTKEVKTQVNVAAEKTLDFMDAKAAGTKKFAKVMQDFGDVSAGAGAIVTLTTGATGVGAAVGGTMMTVGAGSSLSGSILESVVDLYVAGRNGEFDGGNAFKTIGLEVVGKVVEIGLKKVLPGYGARLAEEGVDTVMNNAVKATVKMNEVALDRTVGAAMEKKE